MPGGVSFRGKGNGGAVPPALNPFDLSGRVAVVTGGGGGIGRPISVALAKQGADVFVVGRRPELLEETCSEIRSCGGHAQALPLDVTKRREVFAAFEHVAQTSGGVDILVNGAGSLRRVPALEITEEGWDELFAINLKGVFFCCQAAAPPMMRVGRGRIINLSSLTAEIGLPNLAAYGASKGGVNQLTRALAVEWAAHGITVNAVGPGRIRTAMSEDVFSNPSIAASFLSRIPMGRPGLAGDVTGAVVFLASDASSYVTGQVLYVDGGWLASGGHPAG
jgi:NAD(P)-dependent dehydrogenase (short-subunit alcohol dehydrogenase family)